MLIIRDLKTVIDAFVLTDVNVKGYVIPLFYTPGLHLQACWAEREEFVPFTKISGMPSSLQQPYCTPRA